ncbi:sn-glycerol-3-phosphate import ATP-binding protein UgpC [Pelagibacterium mangrovi]|uniref:sn-glycerol-3-phosphate import ATP-binding protein UgpC n=1 Tax=Pelagibacterium mangrovi TaxID=3119828 RepID=UPI002FC5D01D
MASITLNSVKKTYQGNVTAIHGLDLSIEDGELVVLVGPSGCGKSTLLRMIAGLETITGGEIRIGETIVNKLEPAERDIAMVFQNYALYPHMSVRQNLEYGLKNRKTPKEEIDRRVAEAARILEIEQFLERKPRQLSGGQRQRVAMGRAIVRQPKAFLFDEPLSNLDAKLRGQMRVEIRRLQRALGTTSVYVTHDQLEAMTLADKLVVMNGGVIEQIGKPLDIYSDPASLFVAGFMGSPGMNLIATDALRTLAGGLPDRVGSGCGTIGIRPEDIALVPPAEPHLAIDATLDAVELVGSESLLYVHGQGLDKELVLRSAGIHRGETGDALKLHVPHTALHCFDAQTGRKMHNGVGNA